MFGLAPGTTPESCCSLAEGCICCDHRISLRGGRSPSAGHGKPLHMGSRDSFRHAPDATTVIAGSLVFPRSPWDAHSLILSTARSALRALRREVPWARFGRAKQVHPVYI